MQHEAASALMSLHYNDQLALSEIMSIQNFERLERLALSEIMSVYYVERLERLALLAVALDCHVEWSRVDPVVFETFELLVFAHLCGSTRALDDMLTLAETLYTLPVHILYAHATNPYTRNDRRHL